ncbi:GntP family permease [Prauserella cavernicola]|uniref:GntP family permease n=1 Tax=Prauserella cavernicola TaxID=2800127 RepID=A0A934QWK0_9PSEU|nr:SLC13 family permease [Prauserella cavernicola]MBK1787741.1 GntP family permease [Prauserella cavernicola]
MVVLHTTIAILAVVLLILVIRVDPVIALVIGSIYLGLTAGLGFDGTITAIAEGFGSIMAEVGLLIGFGVLLGSLLFSMGALQKLVEKLLRALGPRRLPYALAVALSTVFPSIYVDVQLVLAAPLAKSAAPRMGRYGLATMGGALTAGILVGYVFVVPGLGTIAIAGLLDVPLGTMLIYGFLIGPATAALTVLLYSALVKRGFWNKDKDEIAEDAGDTENTSGGADPAATGPAPHDPDGGVAVSERTAVRTPPLAISLLPIIVPLLLIATGAITEAAGVESSVLAFLGDPVFALFVGLLGAYALAKRTLGGEQLGEAMTKGFNATGQILLITGIGGSLGAVIGETDLENVLGGFFSAEAGVPAVVTVLLAWLVAAVLHLAIGSISVAAITAAGILAPIMGGLDIPAEVLGLAIGSGALFALHVNSNFFWMFQTLLGVTTRGALKALTFVTALASVVSLVIVAAVSVVL